MSLIRLLHHHPSCCNSFPHLPFKPPLFKNKNLAITHCTQNQENELGGLLGKPSPMPIVVNIPETNTTNKPPHTDNKDEALEPFYKFFRDEAKTKTDSEEDVISVVDAADEHIVSVEYYDPQPGDFVVGVVVSGNEYKLDVNIGADLLATMLTKEVLPLYDKELDSLLSDFDKMVQGKMGIIRNDEALSDGPMPGQPVVEHGTVLFAQVLGRTLSGRPLISTRRLFRRLAWHRVRQVFLFFDINLT